MEEKADISLFEHSIWNFVLFCSGHHTGSNQNKWHSNSILQLTFVTGIQIAALNTTPKGQIIAKDMYNHFFLKWVLCQMGWTMSRYLERKYYYVIIHGFRKSKSIMFRQTTLRRIILDFRADITTIYGY